MTIYQDEEDSFIFELYGDWGDFGEKNLTFLFYEYCFISLYYALLRRAVKTMPHKNTVFSLLHHQFPMGINASISIRSNQKFIYFLIWRKTFLLWMNYIFKSLLFSPKPEYFFNWIFKAHFSGNCPWSLKCNSFEKSCILLLLEHQTFLVAKSFLFSSNVILA